MIEDSGRESGSLADFVREGYHDPGLLCRKVLGHWFTSPLSWVQRGLLAILTRKSEWLGNFGPETWGSVEYEWTPRQLAKIIKYFVSKDGLRIFKIENGTVQFEPFSRVLIMLPRGLGKTTIVNAANLHQVLYEDLEFLLYISEAATHSENQLENIKRELSQNELIKAAWPNLVPTKADSQVWRQDQIETMSGISLVARGRGGQVRGLNIKSKRPDRIVLDDVEDKESVATDGQRQKTMTWFKGDVEPALDQRKGGDIIAIGTLLGEESLLMKISQDPDWLSVIFGAMDPEGEPISSHYMTLEQYERKKASFARVGKLKEFFLEYGSTIRNEEGRKFDLSKVTYGIRARSEFVKVAMALDPAIAEQRKNSQKQPDFSVLAVVGMTERGKLHVLDLWTKVGASPREIIDEFFRMKIQWDVTNAGVEAIAYQKALVYLIREEMFRKAKSLGSAAYFEVEAITHGSIDKITRVEGILSPRYAAGYISHQKVFPELEIQLEEWPFGKKDAPDAVAMAVMLLQPYAALAFEPDELDGTLNDPLAKDQYEPLEFAPEMSYRNYGGI